MTLTTPLKIILALVIIVLIGLGFWLLDWQAKHEELASLQAQKVERQKKLDDSKELVKELPVLAKEKRQLEDKLKQVVQTNLVPEKPELFVANYIKEIEALMVDERNRMRDETFDIQQISPGDLSSPQAGGGAPAEGEGETPDALKSFPTRVFSMQMKGKYSTLIDFLYQLGALKLERLVTIDKINLSAEGGKGAAAGLSPTLNIAIPITAYMRQGG